MRDLAKEPEAARRALETMWTAGGSRRRSTSSSPAV